MKKKIIDDLGFTCKRIYMYHNNQNIFGNEIANIDVPYNIFFYYISKW